MDAIKFINEANRMCHSHDFCNGCPAFDSLGPCKILYSNNYSAEEKFSIVEEWAKKHPIKTRQSVFLEQWPNVRLDANGLIDISPCRMDHGNYPFNGKDCCKFRSCGDCRREFWMQEVK